MYYAKLKKMKLYAYVNAIKKDGTLDVSIIMYCFSEIKI